MKEKSKLVCVHLDPKSHFLEFAKAKGADGEGPESIGETLQEHAGAVMERTLLEAMLRTRMEAHGLGLDVDEAVEALSNAHYPLED